MHLLRAGPFGGSLAGGTTATVRVSLVAGGAVAGGSPPSVVGVNEPGTIVIRPYVAGSLEIKLRVDGTVSIRPRVDGTVAIDV